jgi:hypothetical protein
MLQSSLGVAAAMMGAGPLLQVRRDTAGADGMDGPNVVVQWNNATLQAIRDTHPGPPMTARALAIVHTCIYDAWAVYDPVAVGTQLAGMLRIRSHRSHANRSKAISFAAYRALVDLFPTEVQFFDHLMTSLGYDYTDTSTDTTTPSGIGNVCAQAVITFRHGDASNQLGNLHWPPYSDYTGYTPVNAPGPAPVTDPNHWQPLRVSNGSGGFVIQTSIGSHWGLVTPFALTSGSQFRPAVGPETTPFGPGTTLAAGYLTQAEQLLHYSAQLDDTSKMIAEYWKDGPRSEQPPGHWQLIGHFVSARDHHDLDDDVQMFFALANAVFDAGIAAWDAKRFWDSARPITAIHWLYGGQSVTAWSGPCLGTGQISGNTWEPYQPATIVTPPFPEYISGHSTFSAAAAEILRRFTGSDGFGASVTLPARSSTLSPAPPRTR